MSDQPVVIDRRSNLRYLGTQAPLKTSPVAGDRSQARFDLLLTILIGGDGQDASQAETAITSFPLSLPLSGFLQDVSQGLLDVVEGQVLSVQGSDESQGEASPEALGNLNAVIQDASQSATEVEVPLQVLHEDSSQSDLGSLILGINLLNTLEDHSQAVSEPETILLLTALVQDFSQADSDPIVAIPMAVTQQDSAQAAADVDLISQVTAQLVDTSQGRSEPTWDFPAIRSVVTLFGEFSPIKSLEIPFVVPGDLMVFATITNTPSIPAAGWSSLAPTFVAGRNQRIQYKVADEFDPGQSLEVGGTSITAGILIVLSSAAGNVLLGDFDNFASPPTLNISITGSPHVVLLYAFSTGSPNPSTVSFDGITLGAVGVGTGMALRYGYRVGGGAIAATATAAAAVEFYVDPTPVPPFVKALVRSVMVAEVQVKGEFLTVSGSLFDLSVMFEQIRVFPPLTVDRTVRSAFYATPGPIGESGGIEIRGFVFQRSATESGALLIPRDVLPGDMLVITNFTSTNIQNPTPSGWTALPTIIPAFTYRQRLLYKIAAAGDANTTVSLSGVDVNVQFNTLTVLRAASPISLGTAVNFAALDTTNANIVLSPLQPSRIVLFYAWNRTNGVKTITSTTGTVLFSGTSTFFGEFAGWQSGSPANVSLAVADFTSPYAGAFEFYV